MHNAWYVKNGSQGDIVLSSRVRLARNLADYPFPRRLSGEGVERVNRVVVLALSAYQGATLHGVRMDELTPHSVISLAEKHLISPEFTEPRPNRMLVLSDAEDISIMLCEEDHIRIRCMCAGFAPEEAYAAASALDDFLDERLNFAFDERLGYLSQNPANIGTAMRAMVMLHLPALAENAEIPRLSATVEKLGLSLRAAYGDGNAAKGEIYQLCNRLTLGISEKSALDNLKAIALQIITRERAAREVLMRDASFEQKVQNAYDALCRAEKISADAMMEALSFVRLGAVFGTLPLRIETVNEMIATLQPATVNTLYGEPADSNAREVLRAQIIRSRLETDRNETN